MIDLVKQLRLIPNKIISLPKIAALNRADRKIVRAYEEVAAANPDYFKDMGYRLIRDGVKPSAIFEGDRTEYKCFKKVWEKRYNGLLPDFF